VEREQVLDGNQVGKKGNKGSKYDTRNRLLIELLTGNRTGLTSKENVWFDCCVVWVLGRRLLSNAPGTTEDRPRRGVLDAIAKRRVSKLDKTCLLERRKEGETEARRMRHLYLILKTTNLRKRWVTEMDNGPPLV